MPQPEAPVLFLQDLHVASWFSLLQEKQWLPVSYTKRLQLFMSEEEIVIELASTDYRINSQPWRQLVRGQSLFGERPEGTGK